MRHNGVGIGVLMRKKLAMYIDITGPDGNIHFILGKVYNILKKEKRINEYNELRDNVYKGNYYQALYRINKVVEMIDISQAQVLDGFIKEGKIQCVEVGDE